MDVLWRRDFLNCGDEEAEEDREEGEGEEGEWEAAGGCLASLAAHDHNAAFFRNLYTCFFGLGIVNYIPDIPVDKGNVVITKIGEKHEGKR
ncbi:hypothetical protein Pmani_007064 [Petrolisthes manimaculis]|uniref:Uncharacterized protein n=1 Tax=Petrolisthes manimaculis TaxID=1843537 RepID=A0AAE1Q9L5_9EUCA|nr:hypothetical protein Pmani_007064 [Petrolisthes manimaculis]